MKEIREVIFAAWISNLDRFYEDGQERFVTQCSELLEQYMDVRALLQIVQRRDEKKEQWEIVEYAKDLSLCETEKKDVLTKRKNLTSVFSRVTTKDEQTTKKKYYPLGKESVDSVFPVAEAEDTGLKSLALEFETECVDLKKCPPKSWEDFLVVFDTLCRKYMWCITASDYEGEDISLYNQSRIAAAIASCICKCSKEGQKINLEKDEPWFELVVGDFSGIQKYIFAVANVSTSGVAKRLRARSFYVDITVSVIAQEIIHKFQLTQNHILMQTGGKFYLLLPNCENSDQILEEIEKEVETSFYSMFKGQVAVHLAWLSMGATGLENYSKSVTDLMRILGDKKSRAFFHTLTWNGKWNPSRFVVTDQLSGKTICPSCKNEFMDKGEEHCPSCRIQEEMGGKLPKTHYIAYYRGEQENAYHIYGDYWIKLLPVYIKDEAFLIEQLNGGDIPAQLKGYPLRVRYMANHIPVNSRKNVMTFSDIADSSKGTKKLAVLKADVDNLGYIFADGLRGGKRHFGTISRVNTMSRMLEIFFSGYINSLIEKKEFQNVYSVFSGGDDLFLIGPWNIMPKLAVKIEEEFHRFSADNNALTLSATVSVFHPKEHIANLAELSEKSLKKVKNTSVQQLYPNKEGRDGISFMADIYAWSHLKMQLETGERFAELMSKSLLDISLLRRIGSYSTMYREFLNNQDIMSLMFEPLFHYDQRRNYGNLHRKKRENENLRWFLDEYISELTKNAADLREIKYNLYFAKTTVGYALNLTKEERNHGE